MFGFLLSKEELMYIVAEFMLGMFIGAIGPFKHTEAHRYAIAENDKQKLDSNTSYQVWPLKEKIDAKRKKHSKKSSS